MGTPGLAEALARIEGRFGVHAVGRGDRTERRRSEIAIATGTSLDRIVRGGLAPGEPLAFVGPTSVGKLTLAVHAAAAAQAQGGMVAWIDPTGSFDPLAAEYNGVDLERLIVVRARGERVSLATAATLRSEGFRLVSVDLGDPALGGMSIDELAPALAAVRGSPAALLVVSALRGTRVVIPTYLFERVAWQRRFGRTVGWSFTVGRAHASERALFSVGADGVVRDHGMLPDLAEIAV